MAPSTGLLAPLRSSNFNLEFEFQNSREFDFATGFIAKRSITSTENHHRSCARLGTYLWFPCRFLFNFYCDLYFLSVLTLTISLWVFEDYTQIKHRILTVWVSCCCYLIFCELHSLVSPLCSCIGIFDRSCFCSLPVRFAKNKQVKLKQFDTLCRRRNYSELSFNIVLHLRETIKTHKLYKHP